MGDVGIGDVGIGEVGIGIGVGCGVTTPPLIPPATICTNWFTVAWISQVSSLNS
jgi:hypothetical protein